uniref:Ras-related protein Rab-40C n=1 Tax=Esox lucius TaxID=8010 RepID=A0A6Q2X5W4_ESOLU
MMGTQGSPLKSYDYLLKFLLVGDSDVGKGEILDSLQDGSAESPYAYSSGTLQVRGGFAPSSDRTPEELRESCLCMTSQTAGRLKVSTAGYERLMSTLLVSLVSWWETDSTLRSSGRFLQSRLGRMPRRTA